MNAARRKPAGSTPEQLALFFERDRDRREAH
jgi:hypothetical protein